MCCPRVWIGSGILHCAAPFHIVCFYSSFVLCCCVCCGWGSAVGGCVPLPSSVFVFVVTALLVWVCVFVAGLCYWGIAVMVCVGRRAVCVGVCGLFVCLPLLLPLPLCCGVRGSARAALRARTLSPNTIAFPLLCSLLLAPRLSSCPASLVNGEWRGA